VLVAGRVRAESERRRPRDAIAVAVPQASRAITVAGATLAASFALLAIVPIRPFRELALLLCLGVLVDALVVRSVLIPSLLALFGDRAWWPSAVDELRDGVARGARESREQGALGVVGTDRVEL
jgi:RND superfamily putative drug exporter